MSERYWTPGTERRAMQEPSRPGLEHNTIIAQIRKSFKRQEMALQDRFSDTPTSQNGFLRVFQLPELAELIVANLSAEDLLAVLPTTSGETTPGKR